MYWSAPISCAFWNERSARSYSSMYLATLRPWGSRYVRWDPMRCDVMYMCRCVGV